MNVKEMLALGEPIFKQINDAVAAGEYKKAIKILDTEQPSDWSIPLISEATGQTYFHNDIELLEAICNRIFEDAWGYEIVGQPTFTVAKTGVIVTVTVKGFYSLGIINKETFGVASEFVTNSKLIPLATPKAASMAWKNSIKKAGNLFGKSLNRNLENAPIVDVFEIPQPPNPIKDKIVKATTLEDLTALKKDLPPSLMSAYMEQMRKLTKQI